MQYCTWSRRDIAVIVSSAETAFLGLHLVAFLILGFTMNSLGRTTIVTQLTPPHTHRVTLIDEFCHES